MSHCAFSNLDSRSSLHPSRPNSGVRRVASVPCPLTRPSNPQSPASTVRPLRGTTTRTVLRWGRCATSGVCEVSHTPHLPLPLPFTRSTSSDDGFLSNLPKSSVSHESMREAFLTWMVMMLGDFDNFLTPPQSAFRGCSLELCFDFDAFLESAPVTFTSDKNAGESNLSHIHACHIRSSSLPPFLC